MKWLRRIALAIGVLVALAAVGAGVLWWRLRQDPAEIAGAPTMDVAEAERVLSEMARRQSAEPPDDDRPRLKVHPAPPRQDRRPVRHDTPPAERRPYRLTLDARQVAALVVTQVARLARDRADDVRVVVREHDLFAAARLRGTALAGSVLSIAAVPGAGRGGRLCLRLGEPHVGGQRIPAELVEQLGGPGAHVPRSICMNARAVGLPGPVHAARVGRGGVVVEGVR